MYKPHHMTMIISSSNSDIATNEGASRDNHPSLEYRSNQIISCLVQMMICVDATAYQLFPDVWDATGLRY